MASVKSPGQLVQVWVLEQDKSSFLAENHCFTLQPGTVEIHCAWLFSTKAETSTKCSAGAEIRGRALHWHRNALKKTFTVADVK